VSNIKSRQKKAQIGEICAKYTPKEEGGGDTFQPLQTTKATGLKKLSPPSPLVARFFCALHNKIVYLMIDLSYPAKFPFKSMI
jgi:hypothetical protein